jgi:hypothetical protein
MDAALLNVFGALESIAVIYPSARILLFFEVSF